MQQYIKGKLERDYICPWKEDRLTLHKIIYHFKVAKNRIIVTPQKINLS